MELHADFSQRVLIHSEEIDWIASPMPGVDRRMLDRIGEEVARATSIVRYAPNSHFSQHTHGGGEEFIVLEGVFQDEHGDYPVGSYVRNPPTSFHTPGSESGCVIFVKLWQFDMADRTSVKIEMNKVESTRAADRPDVVVKRLFEDDRETVNLERWEPNATVSLDTPGGAELLVLDGSFAEGGDHLRRNSWLRLPLGGRLDAKAGPDGAKVWIKTGHLRFVDPPKEMAP